MEAVVYRMADEFKSIVIERARSKRMEVIRDIAQLSLTMQKNMPVYSLCQMKSW